MPTYAYPSRTQVLDTAAVATLYDALFEEDIPQAYRNALAMQLLLRQAREPGLFLQGQDIKLPGVAVKRKTMGGTRAEVFVNFEDGVTAQWFAGLDILNTSIADGPTVTWSDWSYLTAYVAIAFTEKVENTGAMKRLDILRSRQNQEVRKMVRTGETALWSANTDAVRGTQNAFAGIQHKIAIAPSTGVLQGLDRSVFTTWRNQFTTSVGSFAAGGIDAMRAMHLAVSGVNAMEPPHLWATTSSVAGYIIKAAENIHRVVGNIAGTKTDLSSALLPMFMGVPIVHTDDCPTQKAYVFNFDYMVNLLHEGAQWTEIIPGEPNDQAIKDQKRYVLGAAPMMLLRPERFGVLGGITA